MARFTPLPRWALRTPIPRIFSFSDSSGRFLRGSPIVHQGLVNCSIGRFIFHEEFEFLDPLPAPVTCPTGTTEFDLQQEAVAKLSSDIAAVIRTESVGNTE